MERKRPSPPVSGKEWRDFRWTLHNAENVTLSGLYVYPIKSCAGISILSRGEDLGEEVWLDVAAADHGHR
jgi:hypothetical protein